MASFSARSIVRFRSLIAALFERRRFFLTPGAYTHTLAHMNDTAHAAAVVTIAKAQQRAGRYSSYADALDTLQVGDWVMIAKSCSLVTVATVEHRDGGLTVFSGSSVFAEAAPALKRPPRTNASRNQRGVDRDSVRFTDGRVRPKVDRRSKDAGDMGGISGYGCLD